MKWQYESIGDVCLVGDGAHTKIQRQNEGVLYLTCKNFKEGMVDLSKVDYISEEDYIKYFRENSKALTKPEVGDILFSIIGTLGEPYLYKEQDRFGISSSVSILRPNLSKIHPHYLYYWIESHKFQKALYGIKGGVAQSYVSLEMIRALPINYPDVKTQQKIADFLSNYDDLIENNRRRIELLEESARSLYREWFVYLRFPGHEHTPIIDGIPEGWEKVSVPEIIIINPSEKIEKEKEIWYVPMSSLSEIGMTLNLSEFERRTKHTSTKFRNGDILFARITPCLENGKTAFVNCLVKDEIACGSTEFIVLRGKKVSPYFTYFLSRSYDFREKAIKSMIGSSGRQRVQTSCFNEFYLGLPPKVFMLQFDEFVSHCFTQIQNLLYQNQKLQQARDLLLPRLMNGEIAV